MSMRARFNLSPRTSRVPAHDLGPTALRRLLWFACVAALGHMHCVVGSSDEHGDATTAIDGPFADVQAVIHPDVATVLVVTWDQQVEATTVHVEFNFENDEWTASPEQPASPGPQQAVILGVPALTDVAFRIVAARDGIPTQSRLYSGRTGELPKRVPVLTVHTYDPELASAAPWMLASMRGSNWPVDSTLGPSWVLIADRQGRVVWYQREMVQHVVRSFPRVARDGTHIVVDEKLFTEAGPSFTLERLSLDYSYEHSTPVPDFSDAYAVTDWGSVLYNTSRFTGGSQTAAQRLLEMDTQGNARVIWDCDAWASSLQLDAGDACYSNTVHWHRESDTILLSMPYIDTIHRIARATGEIQATWGSQSETWTFDPQPPAFDSTTIPASPRPATCSSRHMSPTTPTPRSRGEHCIVEFEIDAAAHVLRQVWSYGEGVTDWPAYRGMGASPRQWQYADQLRYRGQHPRSHAGRRAGLARRGRAGDHQLRMDWIPRTQ